MVDCSTSWRCPWDKRDLSTSSTDHHNELYVMSQPRASRTVPYISKVTGVPMVDCGPVMVVRT